MLKTSYFIVLLAGIYFFSCTDIITSPGKDPGDLTAIEKQVASSTDVFGLKLFKEVNKEEENKNIFISPLSVSLALGMTLNGANGSTYEAIKSTLELNGLNPEEINEAYKNLSNYLVNADPEVISQIANSVWYRDDMIFKQSFIDASKEFFSAQVTALDFTNPASVITINNWVKENTNNLIEKIIENTPRDAIMYLINAIYFKGTWTYEFNKEKTVDDIFYVRDGEAADCRMMYQSNKFQYYNNEIFQAVELPYGEGTFNMTVILSHRDQDVNSIIENLNEESWNALLNGLSEMEGVLWLPKFNLEYKLLMNDVLKALGMGIAFDGHLANFTNLQESKGIYISRVIHKTYIDVYEEGTEASAVTAVELGRTSVGDDTFSMKVNRPFIFIISEKYSGAILFIGKIVRP